MRDGATVLRRIEQTASAVSEREQRDVLNAIRRAIERRHGAVRQSAEYTAHVGWSALQSLAHSIRTGINDVASAGGDDADDSDGDGGGDVIAAAIGIGHRAYQRTAPILLALSSAVS